MDGWTCAGRERGCQNKSRFATKYLSVRVASSTGCVHPTLLISPGNPLDAQMDALLAASPTKHPRSLEPRWRQRWPACRRSSPLAALFSLPSLLPSPPLAAVVPSRHRFGPAAIAASRGSRGDLGPQPTSKVQDDEVVDGKILQYCSIDKKDKKTLGELEQEFLRALQVLLHRPDEQKLLEASMAYVSGNPIMTDAEFDELKLRLKVHLHNLMFYPF
ncbi:hypothetical protein BHE74_00032168 [Ensete ventricosum]|nr:hypothetical protein GW17_00016562 [Ensete ventricosum]RWW60803.1 hypothetical protein BHE74_00032168 [Ensete ventricosum]